MTIDTVVNKQTGEIVQQAGPLALEQLRIDDVAIANVEHNIKMAERLVTNLLDKGIDWGPIPGVKGDSLFDPGASKIFNAFNCYAKHVVIYSAQEEDLISFVVEAQIISRLTTKLMTTGCGAASTREVKYKYRWVPDPENYGLSPEEVAKLKKEEKDGREGKYTVYRIENPEYGDLVNTILTMACKRSEVDAAKSMPGVGSALKRLFDPRLRARKEPDWDSFWSLIAKTGLDEPAVHKILGVASMKSDWTDKGKTLEQAMTSVMAYLKNQRMPAAPPARDASTLVCSNIQLHRILSLIKEKQLVKPGNFLASKYKVAGKTLEEVILALSAAEADEYITDISSIATPENLPGF